MTTQINSTADALTPDQEALKAEITRAHRAFEEAEMAYHQAKNRCTHVFREVQEEAVCAVCGVSAGWWCPKSPTHCCEYALSEICIHCEHPDERK